MLSTPPVNSLFTFPPHHLTIQKVGERTKYE